MECADRQFQGSRGNGGAAIAAFGVAAGIKVTILCPATTQPAKVAQMRAFGAAVQLVTGPREECEHEAIRQSAQTFDASLRALGGPRLPRAGQRDHPRQRGLQCAGL